MKKSTAIILAGLCIGSAACGDRAKNITPTRKPADTQMATTPAPAPRAAGIGISRDSLIHAFQRQPLGFVFEAQKRGDGEDAYFGQSQTIPGGTIELVGPPGNLTNANCLIIVGGSTKDDTRAAIALVNLASLVDAGSTDWLNGQMQLVAKGPKSSRKQEKQIGERLYRFNYIYLEQGGTMSLAIVPGQPAPPSGSTPAVRRR